MNTLLGRLLLISLAAFLAACRADNRTASTPSGPSNPSVPPPNGAPIVTVAPQGSASCNPVGTAGQGCTVTLKALASDPDGDPLTYAWSGTTAFSPNTGFCYSSPPTDTAVCLIYSPEQVVVGSVIVRDDHGNAATATLQVIGEGVNHPPAIRLGPPMALSPASPTLEMFGAIEDPDEGALCSAFYVVSGSATGDCKPTVAFWSSCLEGGPTVDLYRTAQTGTCEVTLNVRDSANLVGTTVTTIRY